MIRWLAALVLLLLPLPAFAQAPSDPVQRAADTLVAALRSGKTDAASFTPAFLAQVPIAQVDAIAAQLMKQNGAVIGIASLTPHDTTEADLVIDYEQAQVRAQFALEPAAPHRFIGLFITGVTRKGDSFDKIVSELKALAGKTALLVTDVAPGQQPLVALNAEQPMATGSTFKLFVLGALARAITQGERRWDEVVPLGPPSLPSGVTQDWPRDTPMTLQTLATQMISISDNTATDTLINVLGRLKVDAFRSEFGTTPGATPVLTTLEAFSLKMPDRAALRARWIAGGQSDRRQVVNEIEPAVEALDRRVLGGGPAFIDTVEWPATMAEVARVLASFKSAPPPVQAILAVNASLAPDVRSRFAYAGYKGGSETGVIAMSWLVQTKAGRWIAVTGAWNNAEAALDNAKFEALMARAVALVAAR